MTISHRDSSTAAPQPAGQPKKVARMACCCKLSDLLPLVRQQGSSGYGLYVGIGQAF